MITAKKMNKIKSISVFIALLIFIAIALNTVTKANATQKLVLVTGEIVNESIILVDPLIELDPETYETTNYGWRRYIEVETYNEYGYYSTEGGFNVSELFETEDGGNVSFFSFVLPVPYNLTKLVFRYENWENLSNPVEAVMVINISKHAPVIENIVVEDVGENEKRISWQAHDIDNDSLVFNVYYFDPEGYKGYWDLIAFETTEREIYWNTSRVSGTTSGIIKVEASDGYNIGTLEYSPVSIERKAPEIFIISPLNNSAFTHNESIYLDAYALDPEQGSLENVTWVSSIDGVLCHEASCYVNLSNGVHSITAEVCDSDGNYVSDEIVVEVSEETRPDAYILDIAVYPEPATNVPAYVTAYIFNKRNDNIINVSAYLDGINERNLIYNETVYMLANSLRDVVFLLNITETGNHTLYVKLDSWQEEENTENNLYETSVYVHGTLRLYHGSLRVGWNLLSFPLEPLSDYQNAQEILRQCGNNSFENNIVTYEAQRGYVFYPHEFIQLKPGEGYWVLTQEACNFSYYGYELTNASVELKQGWNLVGFPIQEQKYWPNITVSDGETTLSITQATAQGWLQGTIYYFDGTGYKAVGLDEDPWVKPGYGYWIYASYDNLTLTW